MNKYQIVKQLGDGSFGSVIEARNMDTNERVAIKKMKKKYYSWEECLGLREVKSLKKINNHVNIIRLKEVIRENDELHFVFEFADGNLYQKMKDQNGVPFEFAQVQRYTHEMLMGLAFMHKHGFFHRDMKPENLLLVKDVIKIADFGLARETRSLPPYTEYVSTRWYRAPEVLLRSISYSSPVDIWAIGTIVVELFNLQPLFPGDSEIDEIFRICSVCGVPLPDNAESPRSLGQRSRNSIFGGGVWPEGLKLAAQMGFKFKNSHPIPIADVIPQAPDSTVEMVADMLKYDPQKRPTASESLRYEWFNGLASHEIDSSRTSTVSLNSPVEVMKPKFEPELSTIPMITEKFIPDAEVPLLSMTISKNPVKHTLAEPSVMPDFARKSTQKLPAYNYPIASNSNTKVENRSQYDNRYPKALNSPEKQDLKQYKALNSPEKQDRRYQDSEYSKERKKSITDLSPYLTNDLYSKPKIVLYTNKNHIQRPAEVISKPAYPMVLQRKKSIEQSPVKSFFTDFFKKPNPSPSKILGHIPQPNNPAHSSNSNLNNSSFALAKKTYGVQSMPSRKLSSEIPRVEVPIGNTFALPPLQNVTRKKPSDPKSGRRRSQRTLFGIN